MGEIKTGKKERKIKRTTKTAVIVLSIAIIISGAAVTVKTNLVEKIKNTLYPIPIDAIELSCPNMKLEKGQEQPLKTVAIPDNYTEGEIEWYSSDPGIVSVDNGSLKAVSPGCATIYAFSGEVKSNKLEIECIITASGVAIENKPDSIIIGNTLQLQAKVIPEDATEKKLMFQSSDTSVAQVDETGNITAQQIGSAEITILNSQGYRLDSFILQVVKYPVESINIDDSSIKLGKGQSYVIASYVSPDKATYKEVTWKTSDRSVVTVDGGMLKAIGEGSAVITASTDQGDRTAECRVKVSSSAPDNTILYANGIYNVRRLPAISGKVMGQTYRYEAIEFLKDVGGGWFKARTSKGICGYVLKKPGYYLQAKPTPVPTPTPDPNSAKINNVPYINQFTQGFPTGCEAVSAVMVLNYYGCNVDPRTFIASLPCGREKHKDENGVWYGANPFKEFVGNPAERISQGSYGCFSEPIEITMKLYAGGHTVKNISGCSSEELLQYMKSGHPVVVWCTSNAVSLQKGVVWQYMDGSGSFEELVKEHCAVLIGYDSNYVYLNDPSVGKNVKQPKDKFLSNWKQLYSQAIIME